MVSRARAVIKATAYGPLVTDEVQCLGRRKFDSSASITDYRECYDAGAYGRQGAAQRLARGIRTRLENSRMDDVFQHGLHEFIGEFVADNNRLGTTISQQYLV